MFYFVLLILAGSVNLSFQQASVYTLINPQIGEFHGLRNDYFHYRDSMIIAKKNIADKFDINMTVTMKVANYQKDLMDAETSPWAFNTISMPICNLFKPQDGKNGLAVKSILKFLGWNKFTQCPIPKARYPFQEKEKFDFSYDGPRSERLKNGFKFYIIYNIMTNNDISTDDGKKTTLNFSYNKEK